MNLNKEEIIIREDKEIEIKFNDALNKLGNEIKNEMVSKLNYKISSLKDDIKNLSNELLIYRSAFLICFFYVCLLFYIKYN